MVRCQVAAGCAPALPDLATWTLRRLQVVSPLGTHGQSTAGRSSGGPGIPRMGQRGPGTVSTPGGKAEKPGQCESQAHDFSSKIEQDSFLPPISLFQGMIGRKNSGL